MSNHLRGHYANFKNFVSLIWLGLTAIHLLIGAGCTSNNSASHAISAEVDRSQLETLQSDLQNVIQQFDALQTQLQEQQQLLATMRHQMAHQLLPIAEQMPQQQMELRKQTMEFRRLQRNLRELRLFVDSLDALNRNEDEKKKTSHTASTASVSVPSQNKQEKSGSMISPKVPAGYITTPDSQSKVHILFEKGKNFFNAQQYLQAIEAFEELQEKFPDHPYAFSTLYWVGESYFALNEYQRSAIAYYDFVAQNPEHAQRNHARWKLAQSLEKSGDFGLAVNVYKEIAKSGSPYQNQATQWLEVHGKQ